VVAFSWVRLDEGGAPVYAAVALAIAPVLLPRLGLRLAALAPALVGALWIAFGISPLEARPRDETHEFFGPLWSRFTDGLSGFYDVRVPFDGAEQPNMQGILLIAAFGFCVVLSLAVASRKPILALLALLAGAGWPLTLLPSGGVVYGAILLVAALWLLAGLRVERPTPALAAGALVVLAATGISTSPAIAKVIVPASAVIPIAASDVAVATCGVYATSRISSGTTTTPPPTPKSALMKPASSPISASFTRVS